MVGILSYVTTTTTGTMSGLQHQSSVHTANLSTGPEASTINAAAKTNQQQQTSYVKKSGPRNLSVSFETSAGHPHLESRGKFGLLTKRKEALSSLSHWPTEKISQNQDTWHPQNQTLSMFRHSYIVSGCLFVFSHTLAHFLYTSHGQIITSFSCC